eukprot:1111985-Prymnesium_polylepis.1
MRTLLPRWEGAAFALKSHRSSLEMATAYALDRAIRKGVAAFAFRMRAVRARRKAASKAIWLLRRTHWGGLRE